MPLERLKILIDSSTPIVVIETVEEMRAVAMVHQACSDLNLAMFEWTIADGLVRSGSTVAVPNLPKAYAARPNSDVNQTAIYNTTDPVQALANLEAMTIDGVFVLKDFHRHMDSAVVVRRLRDVAQKFSTNRRTLIITAPSIEIPSELTGLIEYLELPLPERDRLRDIIESTFKRLAKTHTLALKLDAAGVDAMAANLRGLTEEEADRAVSQTLVTRSALCADSITDVIEAKKELLRHSGMLEFIENSETLSAVGGLDNLKQWLALRRGAWDDRAREFGLDPPRGMIVLGVQGCGKSLCARAVAGEWKLPLVKFDTAAVYDKYIGETEKRIQKVFRVAEGLSPCVLWIDELEKIFAGSSPDSASADAGVSSHLLAAFLSWMQDRKSPVFVAATCNDVTVLPPELIRKGRFDELFFVDLPNQAEREQIFTIQLAKRKRQGAVDLKAVAAAAKGYSGAEIDAAIQSALYAAYGKNSDLNTADIWEALKATVPLSVSRSEEIDTLRDWARQRAVLASVPESRAQSV